MDIEEMITRQQLSINVREAKLKQLENTIKTMKNRLEEMKKLRDAKSEK